MIRAIIFDFFGVIVGKGFENTYRVAGGDPIKDRDFINHNLGQANLGIINDEQFDEAMANHLGLSVGQWIAAIERADLPDLELLHYIEELHGSYKTAVLSNANRGVIHKRINPESLDQCFDQVIVSAEIGLVKPDPEIYRLAANKLGVSPDECIFIDDRKSFTDSAAKIGMSSIHYKGQESLKTSLKSLL
jgi:putative hydrolase of the HAD superfamily